MPSHQITNTGDQTCSAVDDPPQLGLSILVSPEHPTVDVVFVHGFTGHPKRTWLHRGGASDHSDIAAEDPPNERPRKWQKLTKSNKASSDRNPVYWPKDLLPHTLPQARVLTFGYDTRLSHKLGPPRSQKSIYDFAKDFLLELEAMRRTDCTRPLLFIAHSLGGIVVKEMLRQSDGFLTHQTHLRSISTSTLGIIFFGTPHSGADPRGLLLHIAESVVRVFGLTANEKVLDGLLPSSERLRELRDNFGPMAHARGWAIHSFQEDLVVKALGRKVVEDGSSFVGEPTLELTQHIAQNHMEMCRFNELNDPEYKKVAAALNRLVEKIKPNTSLPAQMKLSPEERKACMDSLSFDQIETRHATIKMAYAKTCEWLFNTPEYRSWLDLDRLNEHNGFFWIKGKAGSGKSTLIKHLLKHSRASMKGATIISFFFNARGHDLEKSTVGMYRSLLVQIFERHPELLDALHVHFNPTRASIGASNYQWQLETLKITFQDAIKGIGEGGVICFVDALDECPEDDIRDMVRSFEMIGGELGGSGTPLRICFSSRHYPSISIDQCIELVVEGQEGHQQDLTTYLQSRLKIGKTQSSEHIKQEVLRRANGIFLWVILVVQILQKEFDSGRKHTLLKRLNEIPAGLDELFKDILTRDTRNSEDLLLCLQWILFAKRPLKREELYYAILAGSEPDQLAPLDPIETTSDTMYRFILDCSKGLAELTKSKIPTVQFIHESVRDYLLKGSGLAHLRNDLAANFVGASHEKLKLCCHEYLQIDVPELTLSKAEQQNDTQTQSSDHPTPQSDTDVSAEGHAQRSRNFIVEADAKKLREALSLRYPFLMYAVSHVFDHAEAAGNTGIAQGSFMDQANISDWTSRHNAFEKFKIRQYSATVSSLYILAEKNLPGLIRTELEKIPHMDIPGERHQFPLRAAIASKNKAAILEFLKPAIHPPPSPCPQSEFNLPQANNHLNDCVECLCENAGTISNLGISSVLFWAVATGRLTVVETLLATEKVDLRCGAKVRQKHWVELFLGVESARLSSVTISLSDFRGDRHSFSELVQWDLVKWAVKHEYNPLLKHIFWCSSPTLAAEIFNSTPEFSSDTMQPPYRDLSWTGLTSHYPNLDLSLAKQWARRLLQFAVRYDLPAWLEEILDHNARLHNQTDDSNPLSLALVRDADCEPIAGDVSLPTVLREALLFAAGTGMIASCKVLLEWGIDVNSHDADLDTPLHVACRSRDGDVVQLLLSSANVDVNARELHGQTPLIMAVSCRQKSAVRQLLEREDLDVNARDVSGKSALWWAVDFPERSIVEMLLERPEINLSSRGADYLFGGEFLTALDLARRRKYQNIVEMLEAAEKKQQDAGVGWSHVPTMLPDMEEDIVQDLDLLREQDLVSDA